MATTRRARASDTSWDAIFAEYNIARHDFAAAPFPITGDQIREACRSFVGASRTEPRILCKQDARDDRPPVFQEKGLFILPVANGSYVIVKGDGYVDIPPIASPLQVYESDFPFDLETTRVGNSEMQHLDRSYAMSLLRHFADDDSLALTIRGRKFSPSFTFNAYGFPLSVSGVQTEVDGGYEGKSQVVLVEAKGAAADNTIIRQLYYPFRQWQNHTAKPVSTLFFQRTSDDEYRIWQFAFDDPADYGSIRLLKSARYKIATAYR